MSRHTNSKFGFSFLSGIGLGLLMLAAYAVAQHHEEPSIALEKSTYAAGEDIVVHYSNGPGNKGDWIAVYTEGVVPGSGIFTELWYYANGEREAGEDGASNGTMILDSESDNPENTEVDWPLADGTYDVYFMCCEEYDVLAGPVKLEIAGGTQAGRTGIVVDVDGVWAVSEKGTPGEGANCDRWASGQGSSPGAISDTDPRVQNETTGDANHIRYGAADVNAEPPPCLNFADQSGFSFWGETGVGLPIDGSSILLGEFTHYNTTTNGDLADYNPLENVGLTITFSGDVDAAFQYAVTMVETMNDDVPCKFPDAPNIPPCGEKITIEDYGSQTAGIAIAGKQYTLEMLGFTNCNPESTPDKTLYTREMAIDVTCVYARLVNIE